MKWDTAFIQGVPKTKQASLNVLTTTVHKPRHPEQVNMKRPSMLEYTHLEPHVKLGGRSSPGEETKVEGGFSLCFGHRDTWERPPTVGRVRPRGRPRGPST